MSGDLASESHHSGDHSRNKKVHAAGALPIALPTLKNYMNNPQQGGLIYYGRSLHSVGFNLVFFLRNSDFIDCALRSV